MSAHTYIQSDTILQMQTPNCETRALTDITGRGADETSDCDEERGVEGEQGRMQE